MWDFLAAKRVSGGFWPPVARLPVLAGDAESAVLRGDCSGVYLRARNDVGAPAVHGDDLPAIAELGDCAADGDAGDAVLGSQLGLAGQPGVRREPPGVDVGGDVGGDLDGHGRGGVMPDPVGPV